MDLKGTKGNCNILTGQGEVEEMNSSVQNRIYWNDYVDYCFCRKIYSLIQFSDAVGSVT